ncbi:MAG TPA: FxLYD domain-containing protein [Nitrososphaeraceae archaeon]|nr:FxLYD domain-containing protein [Nitrososphaeraceae archaeon]
MSVDNNKVFPEVHIIGEVLNSSTQPARLVEISATLYDSDKKVIGTGNTFATPSDIQPGHKSHFEIIINIRSIKGGDFSLVKNYAVQASGL